jgi:hypothetical protein
MSVISTILAKNRVHRLDDPIPTIEDVVAAEKALSWQLPTEYGEFVRLGGLNDLRFRNRVFNPAEVVLSSRDVARAFVPFAGNGCGDLYCWSRDAHDVWLWEHDTGSLSPVVANFGEWLRINRF